MADASRHEMFYTLESSYGVVPSNPPWTPLRHTGTNLGLSKSTLISDELRADGEIADVRHGVRQVGGDVNVEFSYTSFDDMMEAALKGTWALGNVKVAITISAAAADNSLNDSAAGFPVYFPGEKITIAGFTGTVGNNQTVTVVSRTASKIIVSGGTALVNDAAGESVTLTSASSILKVGTTRRSFSFMRHFADLSTDGHLVYPGIEINNFSMTCEPDAIITSVFAVLGRDQNAAADAAPSGSSYVDGNTNSVFDCFSGLIYDGATAVGVVTSLNFTLESGLAARNVVGSDKTIRPSIQRTNLSGQITVFFEDAVLQDKFIDETPSSLRFHLFDAANNEIVVYMPMIKYNGGQPDTQGQGPITPNMPFQAYRDPTTGTTMAIIRNPAA